MSDHAATSFDARIVLRPRTLDETLDLTLAYLQAGFRDFRRLFAVLFGIEAACAALCFWIFSESTNVWGITATALLILGPVLERSVTVFTGRHLFGNRCSVWASFSRTLQKTPSLLAASVFAGLPLIPMLLTGFEENVWIGLATMAMMFWPFLLAAGVYGFEVSLLEQLSTGQAWRRARALISFRYGRALGLLSVSVTLRLLFAFVVHETTMFVLEFVLQFEGFGDTLAYWPAIAGYLIAGPFIAIVRVFDYVDARTRREGWDIQVRFNAIAQKAEDALKGHAGP
ncbi:MAG: hypothetical protein H6729_13185 [Deltaproteobacteria bacterium]|nr:hypothetical protein [Deltaproteobacteria bacterium]